MCRRYSRRGFLKGTAAGAAAAAMASVSRRPPVLAQQPADAKLRVAVIGAAGMGGYSVRCALGENLVALVDPACKCYVYDHKELRPEVMKGLEQKHQVKWSEATLFVGTKGYLSNHSRIIPESEHQKFPVPAKTLPRPKAGGPLTAMALAGHLAQYAGVGGRIEWDAEKMECTNRPEFNKFVRREYRPGWEV